MFDLKHETAIIQGKEITVRELSAGEIFEMPEDADKSHIVAACWVSPSGVTPDDVRAWPLRTVEEIYEICSRLMGIEEGND
ncbi:hypothetical protein [Herbaspirillum sp.]|jgi:hypothetical protein|uniref:hypothetical protein n=1 Tax=Herbaspirillum sp. TaxID=1890675 RepID=UPI000C11EDC0|nr:hypothetical protein [Herbaspirillum sp.]MBO18880.1 hypothetical protein [Herbaspirillum sp.]|tara:strand:+ start:1108 stop:1350 length:243 start_codon:yes stop_codon:yes gene_type:complete